MKLLFPNGEHSPAPLVEGNNRIGSSADAAIGLKAEGIAPWHCDILYASGAASIVPSSTNAAIALNGQPVTQAETLRAGDGLLLGANVQVRVVAMDRGSAVTARPAPVDDRGATRVRVAVPKFLLRGVSGAAFGKNYAVAATLTIGRSGDCGIAIPSEEISRQHARVTPAADGLLIEDLGSSNGTYINGKRIQSGLLKPGEELRLDNIRFLLVAPGAEIPTQARTAAVAATGGKGSGGKVALIAGVVLALAAASTAAYFLL